MRQLGAENEMSDKVEEGRLRKKIAQRDRRIAGLLRRITALESSLATMEIATRRLPIDIERAVQHALCNVRMMPVLGLRSDEKIVAVAHEQKAPNAEVSGGL